MPLPCPKKLCPQVVIKSVMENMPRMQGVLGSNPGFKSWVQILGSNPGFKSWVQILGSNPGFKSWVQILVGYGIFPTLFHLTSLTSKFPMWCLVFAPIFLRVLSDECWCAVLSQSSYPTRRRTSRLVRITILLLQVSHFVWSLEHTTSSADVQSNSLYCSSSSSCCGIPDLCYYHTFIRYAVGVKRTLNFGFKQTQVLANELERMFSPDFQV